MPGEGKVFASQRWIDTVFGEFVAVAVSGDEGAISRDARGREVR